MTAPPGRKNQGMMFTKTETEYNMKSIRFLLLTITAMFIVIGIMMIVLGISVYSHYHSFSFFYDSMKGGRFLTPSVMCVFVGFILLVVSSFGFLGSLKMSTCMVNFYALILLKILIVKLALVILAFTTGTSTFMGYVNIPVSDYPVDLEIQNEIDSLQAGLRCCGGNSYLEYIGMDFASNHSTSVATVELDGDLVSLVVPRTCCAATSASEAICTRLHRSGCKQAIANAIYQNATVLGVLGVSVMFILLLGIVFALLLARCIRKLKSERAMMAWKIREQLIMARMEERKAEADPSFYIAPTASSVA